MGSPVAGNAQVELVDGYELLRVIEGVDRRCPGDVVLVPVRHPACGLAGGWGPRCWIADAAGRGLTGIEGRDLIVALAGAAPILDGDGPLWRFDSLASGPLTERFGPLAGRRLTAARQALAEATAEVLAERAALAERARARADEPAWRRCPICSPLPTADEPEPAVAARHLAVIGAPAVSDHGSRADCVKRCPRCATCYRYQAGYSYLVNGASEDETTLTRLAPDEAAAAIALVEASLRARSEAPST